MCVCVCVPPVTDFTGGEAAHCPLCPHTLCIIMFPVGPYKSVRAQLKIAFSMTTPTSTHVLKREKEEEKTHTHTQTLFTFLLNVYLIQQTAECTTVTEKNLIKNKNSVKLRKALKTKKMQRLTRMRVELGL